MSWSRWKVMAGILGVSLGGLATVAGQCAKPDAPRSGRIPVEVPISADVPAPAAPQSPAPAVPVTPATPPAPMIPLEPPAPMIPSTGAPPAAPPVPPSVPAPAAPVGLDPAPLLPPPVVGVGQAMKPEVPTMPPVTPAAPPTASAATPPAAPTLEPPAPVPAPLVEPAKPMSGGVQPPVTANSNLPVHDTSLLPLTSSPPAPASQAPPVVKTLEPQPAFVAPPSPAVVPASSVSAAAAKFRIVLRVGEGEPKFEVRNGDDLILKVISEKIDVKSPEKGNGLSSVKASGKVHFAGFGAEGTCEELSFLAGTGEVTLTGHVKIQVKDKLGRVESELATETVKYRIDVSALGGSLKP